MNITLISIGHKPPKWITCGFYEYIRRLPRECHVNTIEIPSLKNKKNKKNSSADDVKLREGMCLLKAVPKGDIVVVLDEKGIMLKSEELAHKLATWRMDGSNISFIVGGPDGLSLACLERAKFIWSLSPLTFPHFLVRLIFAEQIYRAWTILAGHPYHRA